MENTTDTIRNLLKTTELHVEEIVEATGFSISTVRKVLRLCPGVYRNYSTLAYAFEYPTYHDPRKGQRGAAWG